MALSSFVERTRLKMLVDGATTTADDPTPSACWLAAASHAPPACLPACCQAAAQHPHTLLPRTNRTQSMPQST